MNTMLRPTYIEKLHGALEVHVKSSTLRTLRTNTFILNGICNIGGHNIMWKDRKDEGRCPIPFDGCPFMTLGKKILDCQFGINRKKTQKAKNKSNKKYEEHKFTLLGVIVHSGKTCTSGHYYAYIRYGTRWFKIDDMRVTQVQDKFMQHDDQPYLVFYKACPRPYGE